MEGSMEATLEYIYRKPTRIPRRRACGPGPGSEMSRSQQAEPLPTAHLMALSFFLMETRLLYTETSDLSRTRCSSFAFLNGAQLQSTAKRSAGAWEPWASFQPPPCFESHRYSAWSSTLTDVLEEQHHFLLVVRGARGETLYLTSLRNIKKGNLTLFLKVTCLLCGIGVGGGENTVEGELCGCNLVWGVFRSIYTINVGRLFLCLCVYRLAAEFLL